MKYYYIVYCFRGDHDRLIIDRLTTYPFEEITTSNVEEFITAVFEVANTIYDYMAGFQVISWQEIEVD